MEITGPNPYKIEKIHKRERKMYHFLGKTDREPAFICYTKTDEPMDWAFHLHAHENALEITYIFDGILNIFCGGQQFEAGPDTLVITNPDVSHAISASECGPAERAVLQFRGIRIENLERGFLICRNDPEDASCDAAMRSIRQLMRFFIEFYRNEERVEDQELRTALIRNTGAGFLALVEYLLQAKEVQTVRETEDRPVREMMEFIEQNYSGRITVSSMADKFYMSPYHMERRFKKVTGMTVNHFLNDCRLGEAENMLLFTDEKIPYIASSCGFQNYTYFYSVFRKHNGCTPLAYRQHQKYTFFRRIDTQL